MIKIKITPEDLINQNELSVLLAMEILEYHNKNILSGNNKTRTETKIEYLTALIEAAEQRRKRK